MSITGTWKKIATGAESGIYPETVSFKENGLYEAQAAAAAERHPIWDAGTYRVEGSRIDISTSTDSVIGYDFGIQNEVLRIRASDGAVVQYQRL